MPEFSAGLLAQSASVVAVPFVPPPPASSPLHFGARLLCACLSRVSSLVPQSSAILNAVRFLGPGAMRSQLSQELDSQVNLRIRRVGSRNIIGGPRRGRAVGASPALRSWTSTGTSTAGTGSASCSAWTRPLWTSATPGRRRSPRKTAPCRLCECRCCSAPSAPPPPPRPLPLHGII